MVYHFILFLDFGDYKMQTDFFKGAFLYVKWILSQN